MGRKYKKIIDLLNSLEEKLLNNEENYSSSKIVINYLFENKDKIKIFLVEISKVVVFAGSQLFYIIDYYSLIISSMIFKFYFGIGKFIDNNKTKNNQNISEIESIKQNKILHIIFHVIELVRLFVKK